MFDSETERWFWGSVLEALHEFVLILRALSLRRRRLRCAMSRLAVAEACARIADGLRTQAFGSLMKVKPNPCSGYYVNPVVWGKTVGVFAGPFQTDNPGPGPGGTTMPSYFMLDIFFGRRNWNSTLGTETVSARSWMPEHGHPFLQAGGASRDRTDE